MSFISFEFFVFIFIAFLIYWFYAEGSFKKQNLVLLIGSYLFYLVWSPLFLVILMGITIMTFYLGRVLEDRNRLKTNRGVFLFIVFLVLIPLVLAKYGSFLLILLNNLTPGKIYLNKIISGWIMPLGISFYTFKALSYLFDIYRNNHLSEKSFFSFALYLGFFPQILLGPIEKSKPFLEQISKNRIFNQSMVEDGLLQILWGLFKKFVLADNLNIFTFYCFSNISTLNPSTLVFGAMAYYLQLYFDFSGYSDISMGLGKLFGVKTMQNFNYPIFSVNISDYWKRWHISLSSWLNDYLFTPLSIYFRYYGRMGLVISILITFIISGIWHGTGLNYLLWGTMNGVLYIPLILLGKINTSDHEIQTNRLLLKPKQLFYILLNFLLISITMVVFRAENFHDLNLYFLKLISFRNWAAPDLYKIILPIRILVILVILLDWLGKHESYSLAIIKPIKAIYKYAICYCIIILIIFLSHSASSPFVYNKF